MRSPSFLLPPPPPSLLPHWVFIKNIDVCDADVTSVPWKTVEPKRGIDGGSMTPAGWRADLCRLADVAYKDKHARESVNVCWRMHAVCESASLRVPQGSGPQNQLGRAKR